MLKFKKNCFSSWHYPFFALILIIIVGKEGYSQASLRNHPTSENFRPQQNQAIHTYTGTSEDGDISNEEYHRRRLIHEKLRDEDGSYTVKALDAELQKAFAGLVNPANLFFGNKRSGAQEMQIIEEQAKHLAAMDEQIARAEQEERRWNAQRENTVVIAQNDDDELMREYQESLRGMQKSLESIQKRAKTGDVSVEDARELLNQLDKARTGGKGSEIPEHYKGTYAEMLYQVLGPVRERNTEEMKADLTQKLSDKPIIGKLVQDNEEIVETMTKIMQDEQAIPNLALMVSDRKKLLKFLAINIAIFIGAWIWKRRDQAKHTLLGARFRAWLVRFIVIVSTRLGIFIWFFGAYVSRLWNLLIQGLF